MDFVLGSLLVCGICILMLAPNSAATTVARMTMSNEVIEMRQRLILAEVSGNNELMELLVGVPREYDDDCQDDPHGGW